MALYQDVPSDAWVKNACTATPTIPIGKVSATKPSVKLMLPSPPFQGRVAISHAKQARNQTTISNRRLLGRSIMSRVGPLWVVSGHCVWYRPRADIRFRPYGGAGIE